MNNFDKWYEEDCGIFKLKESGQRAAYILGFSHATKEFNHKAYWKFNPVKNENGQIYIHCYICSNCKAIDEHQGAASYCWSCGAHMIKEPIIKIDEYNDDEIYK